MDATPPTLRGRFSLLTGRWHRSSRVVTGVVFLILVFCNLPGQLTNHFEDVYVLSPFDEDEFVARLEHGWPLAWNVRSGWRFFGWGGSLHPTAVNCWTFWEDVPHYHWNSLVVNLAAALLLAAAAGIAFEWWRRARSRIYQWHLRDCLGLVFVLSLVGAWYASEQRRNAREDQILARDASFEEWPRGINSYQETMGGITWLRTLIGDDPFRFLDRVASVDADSSDLRQTAEIPDVRLVRIHSGATSDELKHLEKMPRLEAIDFDPPTHGFQLIRHYGRHSPDHRTETLILPRLPRLHQLDLSGTDCHFKRLGDLHNLQTLGLSRVYVDEELLREVARLPELQTLTLNCSRIPASGIALLTPLPRLSRLELKVVELNDDDARDMGQLKGLRELELYRSSLTNQGLAHLSRLSHLESLDLSHSQVDGEGLEHLARLPSLRKLNLSGTTVTSQLLPQLQRFRQLKEVMLPGDTFSSRDRVLLTVALPDCLISYQESASP